MLFVNLKDATSSFPITKLSDSETEFEARKRMVQEARSQLLSTLNQIKRAHPDLKVVVTDVKEGASAFGFLPDPISNPSELKSFETIRLVRYGYLFNERRNDIDKVKSINRDVDLQQTYLSEKDFIFNLKFAYTGSADCKNLGEFVEKGLKNELQPHLETDRRQRGGDESVRRVNRAEVAELLKKKAFTVIMVD